MSRQLLAIEHHRGWLVHADPRLKLAWLLAISLVSILVDSLNGLLLLAAASALVAALLRLSWRQWLVVLGLLLLLCWGTTLTQAMFYEAPRRSVMLTIVPGFSLGRWVFSGVHLYREGAVYGAVQSLRMIAVLLSGLTVCLSTSPERLLAALVWLRVPAALSFMTVIALRWLPAMLEDMATLREARKMRGVRFRLLGPPGARMTALLQEVRLLEPLLATSLRRSAALATSVTARGFVPGAPRTFYPPLRMHAIELATIALIALLSMLLTTVKTLYWLSLAGWGMPELHNLYSIAETWL